MQKTLVTHLSVDLDAITSIWLIKKYLPDWQEAQLAFVPAGTSLNNKPPDQNKNIIHVDTGLGKFDHHQIADRKLCAAKLVFDYLMEQNLIKKHNKDALLRIIDFVVMDDNFADVFLPDPSSDIYDFALHRIIDGLKGTKFKDEERCAVGFELLDAVLHLFKNKIQAEQEIKNGYIFTSKLGKSIALETQNNDAIKLALKMGYHLVIKRDPERKYISIKTLPKKEFDLTAIYKKLVKADPKATWFLHVSKNMLLNGTSKNPNMIPTSLSLKEVIDLIKKI